MNIAQEQIDELNAVITVELTPEDYASKVEASLKEYGKKVNLPGFRPGKVPAGVVRKKYGKAILGEEINQLLNQSLQSYIQENKLKVLGSPIPKEDGEEGDWDNPGNFKFLYEVGLAPSIEVKLSKREKYTYHTVQIDDEMVDRQMNDLARRYGKMEATEVVGDSDMVIVDMVELDEAGAIKAGGIMNTTTISIEFLENENGKKALIGKKVGDQVVVNPKEVSKGDADLAAMLNISKDEAAQLNTNFQANIKEVKHLVPSEMNTELFDKLFGEGVVKTEEEFRARTKEDLQKGFAGDSDRLFQKQISTKLSEKLKIALPDEFLKRWITLSNEKPISKEQLEVEYPQYAESLKWQLISNQIIETNEIKVELEEVKEHVRGLMIQQYAQYGIPSPDAKVLEDTVNKVLANQDELRKIFDHLYNDKLMAFIKESVKIEEKEVPFDDFVKLASN